MEEHYNIFSETMQNFVLTASNILTNNIEQVVITGFNLKILFIIGYFASLVVLSLFGLLIIRLFRGSTKVDIHGSGNASKVGVYTNVFTLLFVFAWAAILQYGYSSGLLANDLLLASNGTFILSNIVLMIGVCSMLAYAGYNSLYFLIYFPFLIFLSNILYYSFTSTSNITYLYVLCLVGICFMAYTSYLLVNWSNNLRLFASMTFSGIYKSLLSIIVFMFLSTVCFGASCLVLLSLFNVLNASFPIFLIIILLFSWSLSLYLNVSGAFVSSIVYKGLDGKYDSFTASALSVAVSFRQLIHSSFTPSVLYFLQILTTFIFSKIFEVNHFYIFLSLLIFNIVKSFIGLSSSNVKHDGSFVIPYIGIYGNDYNPSTIETAGSIYRSTKGYIRFLPNHVIIIIKTILISTFLHILHFFNMFILNVDGPKLSLPDYIFTKCRTFSLKNGHNFMFFIFLVVIFYNFLNCIVYSFNASHLHDLDFEIRAKETKNNDRIVSLQNLLNKVRHY